MKFSFATNDGRVRVDTDDVLRVADRRRIQAAATRGAKLLDFEHPGWFRQNVIALTNLDLKNCEVCVLGQIYADDQALSPSTNPYAIGCEALFGGVDKATEFGFDLIPPSPKVGFRFPDGTSPWDEDDLVGDAAFVVLQDQWEHEIRSRRAAA